MRPLMHCYACELIASATHTIDEMAIYIAHICAKMKREGKQVAEPNAGAQDAYLEDPVC